MRKIKFLIFWIYFVLILDRLGTEEIPLTRLIEAYHEAGDYEKAIELLKKLNSEPLAGWQKARIMYNIGTILMYQGLWDEASSAFSSIPLSLHSLPILRPAIKNNLAILNYMKALQLISKEEITVTEYNQALYLLKNALRDAKEALQANCMQDANNCNLQKDQLELLATIKDAKRRVVNVMQTPHDSEKEKIAISPESILEVGIQKQLHSLSLARISEMKEKEPFNAKLAKAHSEVLEAVSSFLPVVIALERRNYSQRCQRKPWEDVIPLFNQGIQSALNAKESLNNFLTLPQSIRSQEQTLEYWQEALNALQKPLTKQDQFCENQNNKTSDESFSKESNEEEPIQNVLRLLLLMDQEDQKLQPASIEVQKGTKPW
jgi:tetratricopeptide (TPR) repeat protein